MDIDEMEFQEKMLKRKLAAAQRIGDAAAVAIIEGRLSALWTRMLCFWAFC